MAKGKKGPKDGDVIPAVMRIEKVVAAINRSLQRVFGPECRLRIAGSSVYSLDGKSLGNISSN